MAEQEAWAVAGEDDEDPWAKAHTPPSPWCEVCEGSHADHAKWLAESAAAMAAWSESAGALEEALRMSQMALSSMAADRLRTGVAAEDAGRLYKDIRRLVTRLRRVTDAAAWRAQQEAAAAQEVPGDGQ